MSRITKSILLILVIGLISNSLQVEVVDTKFQYLELLKHEDITDNGIPTKRAYFRSAFFFDNPNAKTSLINFAATGGSKYIKRSENHIYDVDATSVEYQLFPTINGNHPTKYLYYVHMEFNPVIKDGTGKHVGSEMYYYIEYYDCLDNAITAQDNDSTYIAYSIWTPTHIYRPADLVPFKKYFNSVYNLPYPIVRLGTYNNIYNQVDIDEIVFFYNSATDTHDFSNIETKSLSALQADLSSATYCYRTQYSVPALIPTNFSYSDILINVSALKDPDHCQNLNTDSTLQNSNSFLCSNKPDSKYLDTRYNSSPAIIEQVLVIEPCFVGNGIFSVTGIGMNFVSNKFYRVRGTNPVNVA